MKLKSTLIGDSCSLPIKIKGNMMMPTRFQDGISMELLQWSLSSDANDSKTILVRVSDEEMFDVIVHNLQNAGLEEVQKKSYMSVTGVIKAGLLKNLALCPGVCSVSEVH